MRVGIVALLQESNSFLTEATTLEQYRQDLLAVGHDVRVRMADSHHEVGGFFQVLDEAGIEAVPLLAARALPFGVMTAETLDELMRLLKSQWEQAGRLDGVLVAPHGATVSQTVRDVDGYWLQQLRRWTGSELPIIGTLDPHANLSADMVSATNALTAYRTNPHLDQRQRGAEAAQLMVRTLRGEIRPVQAAAFAPLAINIQAQYTEAAPCLPLYQLAAKMREESGALSTSILLGFPYADVEEMGSAVLAVVDGDLALARDMAYRLGQEMWSRRESFRGELMDIDTAVEHAATLKGSVCLLDMGDNVGGGSPGDGTLLAHAIQQRRLPRAYVCLYDPQVVQQAEAAGVGARQMLSVGGKTDGRHGPPLEDNFTVVGIYDGRYEEPQPRHGGFRVMDQGRTAVLRTDYDLTVMVTSRRSFPVSLGQLTCCQLDPAAFHLLVAKGVHAPVAAYRAVCQHLVHVNTPGVTTADMLSLHYEYRRHPMFPFEPDTEWIPATPHATLHPPTNAGLS